MKRFASDHLDAWLREPNRKPVVLRGARQVGKTWLVRDLAARHRLQLVELNLERSPALAELIAGNDPQRAIENLEAHYNITIDPPRTILFLDEIQAAPHLLATLRWFMEDMRELPVVAAGSLLEFALGDHTFSMPVGRITYLHIEPLSYLEFVLACGHFKLAETLSQLTPDSSMPNLLHEKCTQLYVEYCLVGGMPAVVQEWSEKRDLTSSLKVQQDLLATYRDDFHKYRKSVPSEDLIRVLESVAEQVGNKFVFTRVDPSKRAVQLRTALNQLVNARVCHKVAHTSGRGLPLGAEVNDKFFKMIIVDTGLVSAQLGLSGIKASEAGKLVLANKGGVAEHFVGQQIRSFQAPLHEPRLFYWQRTDGRQGEIDYVFQYGPTQIPTEVKAGTAGSMKSLHQYAHERNLHSAVRCDANMPSVQDVSVKTTAGDPVKYRLLSIPHYLTERLPFLLKD